MTHSTTLDKVRGSVMRQSLESLSVHSVRQLINLSETALGLLLGDPPTNTNGAKLDHQLHALSVFARTIPLIDLLQQGAGPARFLSKLAIRVFDIDPPELPVVDERRIQGSGGPIQLRIYSPAMGQQLPGCVFYHGGGFVLGDLDTHDSFCRLLAKRSNTRVVSVAYRRAPEYPFPAAIKDGEEAFEWVSDHTGQLNIDPDRIAVAGDSAGGTLATVVCQQRILDGKNTPDFQLLMYPKTDHKVDYPSRKGESENMFLNQRSVEWFSEQYRSDAETNPETDPRISPIQFDRLDRMPPTIMATAGFDPLRDEGEAYADKLEEHNVDVYRYPYERLIHGFISIGGIVDRAREAAEELTTDFGERMRNL